MIKKGLISGVGILVLGMVINWVVGFVLPQISLEYTKIGMFRPWTDPLMMLYFLYPFVLGFVSFYLWQKLNKPKAFDLAKLYFIIATIPGMFITYSSFQISLLMVMLWAITGFLEVYLAGIIFTKIK